MYFTSLFVQKLYRIGFLVVLILIALDLLTFFYYPDSPFSNIFLATREQTPLTWISALTFLFIALSSLSAYLETRKSMWYFLSAIFFFFSMDDATYFHERFSGAVVRSFDFLSAFPTYAWQLLYSPLLIFSLGAFIYMAWKETSVQRKKLIFFALVILGVAVFLDMVDGFVLKDSSLVFCLNPSCDLAVLHLMRLTEEVLEVISLGILGYVNIQKHCILKK